MNAESQRATARNLVSALAVAWHGARSSGRPYSVTECDTIGHLSGWVGLSTLAGLVSGYTVVCEVRPHDSPSEVVRLMCLIAAERQLFDRQACQIMADFTRKIAAEQIDGFGPGHATPGDGPEALGAGTADRPGRPHPGDRADAKGDLSPWFLEGGAL